MSKKKLLNIGRKSGVALAAALSLWTLAWPGPCALTRTRATTAPSDMTTDDQSISTITLQPGKAKKMHFVQPGSSGPIFLPRRRGCHPPRSQRSAAHSQEVRLDATHCLG